MANKRIWYAVKKVGISKLGLNTFTSVHGLQSVGINTKFNLEQVFELGQSAIYQNIENIPDIEATFERVLDGYPTLYHLATSGAPTATLSGRSNVRCTVGLSLYSDVQDSASGTPIARCAMSGMYVSAIAYNFGVQGNFTEQVTLVGNNKTYANAFSAGDFNNDDAPSAAEGVNRRQHILFGPSDPSDPIACHLPTDISGVSASGTVLLDSEGNYYPYIQSVKVSTNLGREQLFELGKRGPYHRFINFPVEVRTEIEVISTAGDQIQALEDATSNLTNQRITILTTEGTQLHLGTKNKLSSSNMGGANAGQNGGNETISFTYSNFNDLTALHSADPTTALRP